MSWKASAWAKEQRLGSPAAKSILMCLADYADPDGMIKGWASQSDLADAAEVSERSAREWLQRLEDWGLVERERQRHPSGARAADWIVLRLDRTVRDGAERAKAKTDEPGAAPENLPANSAGGTYRQPDAEPTGNQTHPTGTGCRSYKEEPPIYPPLPSQDARESARESGEDGLVEENPKAIEAAFWRVVKDWPRFAPMPKEPAKRAWLKLSAEDRRLAEARLPGWFAMLKANRKDHVPAPATYFRERLWEAVPDAVEKPAAPAVAAPFGKMWGCLRQFLLSGPARPLPRASAFLETLMAEDSERGERERLAHRARNGWPAVNEMHRAAENRRGQVIAADLQWLEPLAATFEQVRVGSDLWRDWEVEHERRGWPWMPDPGRQEWVYFPAGGPAGLSDFEAAVRGQDGHGDRQEAAE